MKRHVWLVATAVFAFAGLGLMACDSGDGANGAKDTAQDQSQGDTVVTDGVADLAVPDVATDLVGDLGQDSLVPDGTVDVVDDQVVPPECPSEATVIGATCTLDGQQCNYGQECCCGQCYNSLECQCGSGTFGCVATDACMISGCDQDCCDPLDASACSDFGPIPHSCIKLPNWESGRCMPVEEYPSCWDKSQCSQGDVCEGASLCPCNMDCDMVEKAGTCVAPEIPFGCCLSDSDCDLGTNMAFECGPALGELYGLCLPLAGPGDCWRESDCGPNEYCEGGFFCPCGSLCGAAQIPGKCKTNPVGLPCLQDGQCASGEVCVGAATCMGEFDCVPQKGKCLPAPPSGQCWTDGDCTMGTSFVCIGPVHCQGGTYCLIDEHPGVCLPSPTSGCWTDLDCPQPMGLGNKAICAGEWVIPWWTGLDYDADPDHVGECCMVAINGCLQDSDCAHGQSCVGATYSGVGDCAGGTAKPGVCTDLNPWPEEFCLDDSACKPGQRCMGEWLCPTGAHCLESPYFGLCLTDPTTAGSCFEDSTCGYGTTCLGAMICDVLSGQMCGALMALPGTCQPLPEGDLGDPCGVYGGACGPGLACCYPCGIPGCIDQCQIPCDPTDSWCVEGCGLMG